MSSLLPLEHVSVDLRAMSTEAKDHLWFALQAERARRFNRPDACWSCGDAVCVLFRRDDEWVCESCIAEKVGGFVYVVTDGTPRSATRAKIGHSKDPFFRIDALRRQFGKQLEIWLWLPGSREDEKHLHRLLAEHRLEHEWFAWAPVREWGKAIPREASCIAEVLA